MYTYNKKDNTLLKVLRAAGVGSRRKVIQLILQEKVMLNGKVIENFNQSVNIKNDVITIDGKKLNLNFKSKIVLMLHKPKGIVSTTRDNLNRKTVIDILPTKYRNKGLYPVGRLDKDSTGLILLTNDGDLTYRITHPKFEHEKEYLVKIDGILSQKDIKNIEYGIELQDGKTSTAKIIRIRGTPNFNYSLTIHEGKKHQVRRMFEILGYNVTALKRVRIGGLTLGALREGEIKELSTKEIEQLLIQKPKQH